jgi:hypothetical protein
VLCILKFFENTNYKDKKGSSDNENEVISRTLLKIAVVSRHYRQKHPELMPKHGELWKCRIVKEISSGKNRGCFIVEPVEKVDDKSILHLIPGWYDEKLVNGRLLVIPRKRDTNWILPLTHKRIMAEERGAYCVIVQLDALPLQEPPVGTPFPASTASLDDEE